jgi:hypothetical protein
MHRGRQPNGMQIFFSLPGFMRTDRFILCELIVDLRSKSYTVHR